MRFWINATVPLFAILFGSSVAAVKYRTVSAWQTQHFYVGRATTHTGKQRPHHALFNQKNGMATTTKLLMAEHAEEVPPQPVASGGAVEFTEDELDAIKTTYNGVEGELQERVLSSLPTWNPSLTMKLRLAYQTENISNNSESEIIMAVSEALNSVLETQLTSARDLLKELLSAGEIRKLDALIGKAARAGKLDVAFFNVLNMNIKDAAAAEDETPASNNEEGGATRAQILKHVYTRCQEEMEKTIPPGLALLNKLLRTEIPSIRRNQLEHYLCPQPNVITSPDGKEITLPSQPILVEPELLVEAIGNTIKQIRTVERAGGTDRVAAAGMVESCRQIAKEARIVIGENYGIESDELKNFEEGLQPVFRPESAESPYIKGE